MRQSTQSSICLDSHINIDINTQLPKREAVKKLDELSRFLCGNTYRKIMVAWNFLEHQVLLCCDVLKCDVIECDVVYYTVVNYMVLYCVVLYCIILYCIVLY